MRKIVSLGLVAVILGMMAVAILPVLKPQSLLAMSGNGTSGDPYMIYTATDLQNMQNDLDAYYELANDIDASATATWNWDAGRGVYAGFAPVSAFEGHFDGNFYSITDLYINRAYTSGSTEYVGLFGFADGGSVIQNVLVLDAEVIATKSNYAGFYGGVVAGESHGTVDSVCATGTITVELTAPSAIVNGVGGLIGGVHYLASITESFADVDVDFRELTGKSNIYAGGLVGYNRAYTTNCYARGSVYGYSLAPASHPAVGGLAGGVYAGAVTNCYSTGSVSANRVGNTGGLIGWKSTSTITASFWDMQTSGTSISDGGTGKSTAQMKTTSTFTDAGWDFSTIWAQGRMFNHGYPYLRWWYDPHPIIDDIYQVVWFQPNAIIVGTTLPNRTGEEDGIITWGANPAGISISYSMLQPEKEYQFEPFLPPALDIIDPEPGGMTSDVALDRLTRNPLRPLAQILSSTGGMTERLAWLGIAIFVLIALMIYVQLKTTHIVFTSLVGLGVATSFYLIGVFPLWVVVLLVFGLVGSIIYERMPVL